MQSQSVSSGRAGWGDMRQDDSAVNQKSLVCGQFKGSEDICSRIKRADSALKPVEGETMPLAAEACSLWLGIKRAFLQQTKALREELAKPYFLWQVLLENILVRSESHRSVALLLLCTSGKPVAPCARRQRSGTDQWQAVKRIAGYATVSASSVTSRPSTTATSELQSTSASIARSH